MTDELRYTLTKNRQFSGRFDGLNVLLIEVYNNKGEEKITMHCTIRCKNPRVMC